MIKVVFFTTILVLVAGDELTDKLNEKMRGDWTPVKLFLSVPIKNVECYATNNTVVDNYCKCGGKLVPQLKRANHLESNQRPIPIIIVENEQELQEGYNATCQCKDTDGAFVPFPNHNMIRFLNDNYFIAYDKDYRDRKPGSYALILAREVPTTAELEQFLSKIEYIKDEQGYILCTKDFKPKSVQTRRLNVQPGSTAPKLEGSLLLSFSILFGVYFYSKIQ